jgi:hypothetical protein
LNQMKGLKYGNPNMGVSIRYYGKNTKDFFVCFI